MSFGAKDLTEWNPEDEAAWNAGGKKTAFRNLWISIPSLLCGFAVWIYWSVITVQMLNLGFPFEQDQLFTLSAIAGISGATLRIPSSFFIRIAGGRNTIFLTTALLMVPALWTGYCLQDMSTPLWKFQLLALLSGFGGGNFASSMSNINFFFPRKMQGLALGLNAGLGNFGVTSAQLFIPLVMTFGLFGGEPMILQKSSGTLFGKIAEGTPTYIFNAGWVWLLLLVPLFFLTWFGMNNIKTANVSPDTGSAPGAFVKILGMLAIGLGTTAFGMWLMMPAKDGGMGMEISKWLVLSLVIWLTLSLLWMIPGKVRENLTRQYKIFKDVNTWVMTIIYSMTFGSFIGYSAGLPLATKVIFGFSHSQGADGVWAHVANPNGPSVLTYAWIGPFIGALIRPVGGWIADKFGGALVTQVISFVMVGAALGAAYYMNLAYHSATPEQYFMPFFLVFLCLFLASGIGNGSTFRTVAVAFPREMAGPVLGWTSAVAAYGAFIIPQVFGEQIKSGTPQYALYGFAGFYLVCIALNWWFYLSKHAAIKNP